jgi:hypothetical protein
MFAADFSNRLVFFDAITTEQKNKFLVHFAESDILTKDITHPFEKLSCLTRHNNCNPQIAVMATY